MAVKPIATKSCCVGNWPRKSKTQRPPPVHHEVWMSRSGQAQVCPEPGAREARRTGDAGSSSSQGAAAAAGEGGDRCGSLRHLRCAARAQGAQSPARERAGTISHHRPRPAAALRHKRCARAMMGAGRGGAGEAGHRAAQRPPPGEPSLVAIAPLFSHVPYQSRPRSRSFRAWRGRVQRDPLASVRARWAGRRGRPGGEGSV